MSIEKKSASLRSNQEFRKVYDGGAKFHTPFFSAFVLKNDLGIRRFGITVTRKVGCAVIRNRCKRRLREIIKRQLSDSSFVSGFDFVINVKSSLVDAGFNQLEESFAQVFERVCRSLSDQTRK